MGKAALISVTSSMLAVGLVISCSQAENKNAATKPTVASTQTEAPAVSTRASSTETPLVLTPAATPVKGLKNLPPEGGDKPTEAEVGGYRYSYKKDDGKTVATFAPKLLPRDRDTVIAAIRDVIYRSYSERIDAIPQLEGTGAAQTMRISGSKHQYAVVPSSEPTGEIHSLIITQLN